MVSDKPDRPDDFDYDDLDPDDDAPPDERLPPGDARFGSRSSKMLGDLARRALMTGIGAVFMSEETLKSSLGEMKLPKEAMGYVVAQADRTKKEIVAAIARETREFLSKLEVDKMLARALVGNTIEISTRIRVVPKDGGEPAFETSTETAVVPSSSTDDEPKPKRRTRKKST
jgi:hypothetical protein